MTPQENAGPTTPVVPMVSIEDAPAQFEAVGLRPELAKLNLYRMLLQSPQTAVVENEINMQLVRAGVLTKRPEALKLRELAIMRISWLHGDTYVWAHHFAPMLDTNFPGAGEPEGLGVRDGEDHEGFGPAERCLVRTVDQIVKDGVAQRPTLLELRSHLESDAELVELVYCIAVWTAISSFTVSLGVPLEDNYAAWPPDGRSPTS